MFKYVAYNQEFRPMGVFNGAVHVFDTKVVAIQSDDIAQINDLIARTECREITIDEFKASASESSQIRYINECIAHKVSKHYTIADEIAMQRRAMDDPKRMAYEQYVAECVLYGKGLKATMGYL